MDAPVDGTINVVRFALHPTVNWFIDPVIRMLTPETNSS
jgi:hypothetical protein